MDITKALNVLLKADVSQLDQQQAKAIFAVAEATATYQLDNKKKLSCPTDTICYLFNKARTMEHEQFGMILVDNQNGVISVETLGVGTIDSSAVYPREVVKTALANNARGVILFHNHPSGTSEPSEPDKRITQRLKDALALVDITVLDHVVFGQADTTSFADRGWI